MKARILSGMPKTAKVALAALGACAFLAAAAVVGFRVLVKELPSHQRTLQAWVNNALHVKLAYRDVDLRWGWRGPELTFHEASLAAADDASPFLTARTASVGVSPVRLVARLVARREVGPDRLTVEGTELTLVKTAEGELRLQGAPAGARRMDFALDVPPDVEVLVQDSRLVYLDQAQSLAWDFEDVAGSMRRDASSLLLEATARPPSDFAARVEMEAQGFIVPRGGGERGVKFSGDWRASARVRGIDLAVAHRLLPASPYVPAAGKGDVTLWSEWQAGVPAQGNVALSLAELELPNVLDTPASRIDRLAFNGDWRHDGDAWHVALKDVALVRGGRAWPSGADVELDLRRSGERIDALKVRSAFVRLEDLTPFLFPLPPSAALDSWFAWAPRGDLSDASFELERKGDAYEYALAARFAGLSLAARGEAPGIDSLNGDIRADAGGGQVELRTGAATLDWPTMFRSPLGLTELRGTVVWRRGQDAVRLVTNELIAATADASTRTSLELTIPADGSSPRLDLQSTVSAFEFRAVHRYLPAPKMPPSVVEWLDEALAGGRASGADVKFVGPLRAFPFDGGEGRFSVHADVENGELAYISDWPHAEELTGAVEFVNAGFEARGSGRVLGNRTSDVHVAIPDLRQGVLALQANTTGPLGQVLQYLQAAPLISRTLGSNFARLSAPAGTGEVGIDLKLPLKDRNAYDLRASLGIVDGALAFRGFTPQATEVRGKLFVDHRELRGKDIKAIFLDGPVTAHVDTPNVAGYSTRLALEGEVTMDAVAKAFDLPFPERLAGQTTWQGALLIPAGDDKRAAEPKITIDSNLSGVALRYPAPFAKAPGEPINLQLEIGFPTRGGLDMQGYLGPSRRFALEFASDPAAPDAKFEFRRAALNLGGALPAFRADHGVTVDGALPELDIDEWLALARDGGSSGGGSGRASGLDSGFAGADVDVAGFSAFGQQMGHTKLSARRRTDDWQIEIDSNPVSGTLLVPADLAHDPQIVAIMKRLYLSAGGPGSMSTVDPRQLPGLQLHADEFAIGARRLGRLDAEILSDPLGLRLVSFESTTDGFSAQGSGGWFTGAEGDTTRIALTMTSGDVKKALADLGLDPIIEAKKAEVTASVYWAGPPSGDWMQHVNGDLSLHTETGSLVDLAPGAGRVVGLLSISALPRRLALDFRDVFNRGLVFDQITADFAVIDGNAYTDNLKLTGPVAEIGVVGRTGLRDRDYRQQAVVTAEPGKVLPTVGGLLGGPAVAAALLIFTRIFKEPLKGIGRASYCVTGNWEEPMVERLSDAQLEHGPMCAELPPNGMPNKPAEVAAR
jgi:uncharacterized protein (TIGR02099 family)